MDKHDCSVFPMMRSKCTTRIEKKSAVADYGYPSPQGAGHCPVFVISVPFCRRWRGLATMTELGACQGLALRIQSVACLVFLLLSPTCIIFVSVDNGAEIPDIALLFCSGLQMKRW
jgi:hypothetical protein